MNDRDPDEARGFRLGVSVGPLSELLGDLIEITVTESSIGPAESVDWTTATQRAGESSSRADTPTPSRTFGAPSADCLLDTRFHEEEFVITADIPGARAEDLTVGIHSSKNTFMIGKDDTVLARVPLPWESAEATSTSFHNGILEVRLRPRES